MADEKRDSTPEDMPPETKTDVQLSSAETVSDNIIQIDEDTYVHRDKNALSPTPPVDAHTLPLIQGKRTRSFLRLYAAFLKFLPIFAVLGGIFWILTISMTFDSDIGHVRKGSPWFILCCICLAAGIVYTLFTAAGSRFSRQYRIATPGMPEIFLSFFTAGLFGIRFLQELYTLVVDSGMEKAGTTTVLAAVTMLFPALYFVCMGLGKRGTLVTVMAMGSIAHMMFTLFRDYFDFTLPLNSPLRGMATLACAALLLFFIAEGRMHVNLWQAELPFSVFAAACTVLLTGAAGIGQIVLSLTSGNFALLEQVQYLAAAGIAFCRLAAYPRSMGDYVPAPPTKEDIARFDKKQKKLQQK